MALTSIVNRVMSHPYLYSATILARIAVLFATVVWSALVMLDPEKLDPNRYPVYTEILMFASARVWASGGLIICTLALARIWYRCRPHWSGPFLYAAVMAFWTYLAASLFMLPHPAPPAAAACILTVAMLSVFAFISNPKPSADACPV